MKPSKKRDTSLIRVRHIDIERDYPMLARWWEAHNWPHVPKDHLPNVGAISEFEGIPLCAGWLYLSGSAFSMLEYIVTNPKAPLSKRAIGVESVVNTLKDAALRSGAKTVMTSVKSKGLIKTLKRLQFIEGDVGMTNMVFSGR